MIHLKHFQEKYPKKFLSPEEIFSHIHRGDRIFVASACGAPQQLSHLLAQYIQNHPTAFLDTELLHVWTLGLNAFGDDRFHRNFRINSFFIDPSIRDVVNSGQGDYSPVFLSRVPSLFREGRIPLDIAIIQASPPDHHGYMSLGISVDITRAAAQAAGKVICQINCHMPRVHGDSFIHIDQVDFLFPFDEPLIEFDEFDQEARDETSQKIGSYVARLIRDGDTLQIGYGLLPNSILYQLEDRRNLGIHSELLTPGVVDLIQKGVIDNSEKTLHRGKTVASFCIGNQKTYDYIHDNLSIEFKPVDYTNNPMVIANHDHMVAINSALEVDLTGQATAESLGKTFFSGIGGQADFMRGAALSHRGRTILTLPSTAKGGEISRIVPLLPEGAGVTLNRGDIHYVVTEYGIAYLQGKNIRERAMSLIGIAHPKFRSSLIEEAKKLNFIYLDQAFVAGEGGEYPEELEVHKTTHRGTSLFMRPVKISDEPLLKDFFYDLSDQSIYRRFMAVRKDMPHKILQKFVVIDYTKAMVLLALLPDSPREEVVAIGQYYIEPESYYAEVALVVRDDQQRKGVGKALLSHMGYLARRKGLLGFKADVLADNKPMMALLDSLGFKMKKRVVAGSYELSIDF